MRRVEGGSCGGSRVADREAGGGTCFLMMVMGGMEDGFVDNGLEALALPFSLSLYQRWCYKRY